ncbi:DUF1716-domain-containing protein [Rhizodiscina lignyota]|uniref:DUF1716-domain-containing protein n=1 Tax=Rhizodiscina lignyota TaxID=1504668 RepID=A0A9P4M7Y4_9PEZI|nr:DUF1716-domain-containing protein [Rhizodiscina lignyota]
MTSIDDLFKKPAAPSNKRKLEVSHDPAQFYKSAKHDANGDAKGGTHATVEDEGNEDDEDLEAGPALPPDEDEDDPDDEEGRFFGGGVDKGTAAALEYIDKRDAEEGQEYVAEKFDITWVRKLALSFEKKINKNAELRAKYEDDPTKFMTSEGDLDDEVKALSILSEHPELYAEFAKLGCMASLVSLLAHENTDIAIDAIQILSELTDEDVLASQDQWDILVNAALEADLLSLLVSNFSRFDEENEADRDGLYNSLSIFENLASQTAIASRIGTECAILQWSLERIQKKERPVAQNTQYAAELLTILLQASPSNRLLLLEPPSKTNGKANGSSTESTNAIDTLLTLLSPYRRADPSKDSTEEEYVENIFDALTVLMDEAAAKQPFVNAEGVELMLIMLRDGKMAKPRALRLLDHACGGIAGGVTCEKLVDAQGLKTLFGMFMKEKKVDREGLEHLLGIFASLLRYLPADSAGRIRTLAKFMEKDYEKIGRLAQLRREYSSRVSSVDQQIKGEIQGLSAEERQEREYDDLSRRLDAGLFVLQTIDVILAWLVAEDTGAKRNIIKRLAERDESLQNISQALTEQLEGIEDDGGSDSLGQKEMLSTLISFLK